MTRIVTGTLLWLLAAAVSPAEEPLSIGVSVSDLGNPFFVQIARGAESKARELGDDQVNVQVVSSAYDFRRQLAQIDAFVAREVDLILLSAADYEGVEPAIRRAQAAGIKVVAVDVNAKGADATVTTDNLQAGRLACDYLARQLEGHGDVIIINGPRVSSVIERVNGCLQVLDDYPRIQVVSSERNGGGSHAGGLETMTYLLSAFPNVKGVFAINDPSAIGAEEAVRQAGREDVLIVGVDGAPLAEQRLKAEDALFRATAAQFPNRMAERAVELGVRLMRGETLEQDRVLIAPALITRDNLDSYEGW